MDTRQLTYFLAVVDHQGFTAASAALRITQPALSNTVKQLEKECGVPLLHRGARGTRPTEAGKQLATDARRILHDLASTKARMRSIAQGRRGQVTLSVAPAFEWWHLPHALNIVESAAPDIDIDLRDPSPDITLRTLHEGVRPARRPSRRCPRCRHVSRSWRPGAGWRSCPSRCGRSWAPSA